MNILIAAPGSQFGYVTEHYYYSRYLSTNNKVLIVCHDLGLKRIYLDGVDVVYLKKNNNPYVELFLFKLKVFTLCLKNKMDVVLVSYYLFCSLLRLLLPFMKIILDIRTGSIGLDENKVAKFNLIIRIESFFFKNVTINTHSLARELKIKKYKRLPIGAESIIQKLKKFDVINLLYIGILDTRRIEETLIGLRMFIDKYSCDITLRYDIVGFGSSDAIERILKTIAELDMNDFVLFHGRKTIEELTEYFDGANIGVAYIPVIKCYDCQPSLKVFEYLINGIPVIATKTHENTKVVCKENGVLINDTPEGFAEGLLFFVKNIKNYNSILIKKTVEKYSWSNIINEIFEPYINEV